MASLRENQTEIKRGILSTPSGAMKNIVVQKNQVIRIKKQDNLKKKT